MPIDLQPAEAFAAGEERPLAIRPEVIDAVYIVGGEAPAVDARLVEIDASAARRLARITEAALATPAPVNPKETDELAALHRQ